LLAGTHSGNPLLFYRLPITNSTSLGTNAIVCLLGGSSHLGFKGVAVIILSQKKYPDP
jgi:hypothetical protein